eukprot:3322201-Rhodomonas_salina.1
MAEFRVKLSSELPPTFGAAPALSRTALRAAVLLSCICYAAIALSTCRGCVLAVQSALLLAVQELCTPGQDPVQLYAVARSQPATEQRRVLW